MKVRHPSNPQNENPRTATGSRYTDLSEVVAKTLHGHFTKREGPRNESISETEQAHFVDVCCVVK